MGTLRRDASHSCYSNQATNQPIMALYNMASDLVTRQTVWVGTNVVAGKGQANSHTRAWQQDGLSAADLAGMAAHAFRNDVRQLQWG